MRLRKCDGSKSGKAVRTENVPHAKLVVMSYMAGCHVYYLYIVIVSDAGDYGICWRSELCMEIEFQPQKQ